MNPEKQDLVLKQNNLTLMIKYLNRLNGATAEIWTSNMCEIDC